MDSQNIKEIKLAPEPPLYNYVDIAVMDFPNGRDGHPRTRCKVTAQFGDYDIDQLKKQGLDYEGAVNYYEDWLYRIIKLNLAQDWTCVEGWDQVMGIIEKKLAARYDA